MVVLVGFCLVSFQKGLFLERLVDTRKTKIIDRRVSTQNDDILLLFHNSLSYLFEPTRQPFGTKKVAKIIVQLIQATIRNNQNDKKYAAGVNVVHILVEQNGQSETTTTTWR